MSVNPFRSTRCNGQAATAVQRPLAIVAFRRIRVLRHVFCARLHIRKAMAHNLARGVAVANERPTFACRSRRRGERRQVAAHRSSGHESARRPETSAIRGRRPQMPTEAPERVVNEASNGSPKYSLEPTCARNCRPRLFFHHFPPALAMFLPATVDAFRVRRRHRAGARDSCRPPLFLFLQLVAPSRAVRAIPHCLSRMSRPAPNHPRYFCATRQP